MTIFLRSKYFSVLFRRKPKPCQLCRIISPYFAFFVGEGAYYREISKRKSLILLFPFVLFCLTLWGCSKGDVDSITDLPREYVLGFVEINAPNTISEGDTLSIIFEMLMPSTNHRYSHYQLEHQLNKYNFTLWGLEESGSFIPSPYIARLLYPITDCVSGECQIIVHLANGDSVLHVITIE